LFGFADLPQPVDSALRRFCSPAACRGGKFLISQAHIAAKQSRPAIGKFALFSVNLVQWKRKSGTAQSRRA